MRSLKILFVSFLLIGITNNFILGQDLEVVGNVKIGILNKVDTSSNLVVRLSDGTLGIIDVDKELPMALAPGEMLYWNGTAWVTVAPGSTGQVLSFVNGVPTWVTTVGPTDVYNFGTGEIWMDRNLGATQVATMSDDAASYGDLYQWGRGTDGHQIRTSGITGILSGTDEPGHGDFIEISDFPFDWRSPQENDLWQGVNGINNPCPAGYRIPTSAEWKAERLSWSPNNNALGAFTSPLKLPLAGKRSSSPGSLSNVGSEGYYWSSTTGGTSSEFLLINSGYAGPYTDNRASGYSVRCIKD